MDRYLEILRALRAGRDVPQGDIKYFIGFAPNADSAQYEKLKAKISTEEGLKNFTDEDFSNYMNEAKKMLTTGKYKEDVLAIASQAEQGKVNANLTAGLNTLLAGTDIMQSIQQIKQSKQLLNQTRRPTRPGALTRDAMLQQALNGAQGDVLDQSRALAPARLDILDQYQSDLGNARTASTGQAGAYGAYSQVAANRRDRANLNLVPLQDQIRQRAQGRYDQLLGMHLNENQAINQSQSQFYPQDLYQYGLDRAAAGELGQIGHQNLRSSLTGLAAQIPSTLSRYATNRKYNDLYNQMSVYGAKNAQYMVDAHKGMDDHWGNNTGLGQDLYEQAYN